MKQRFTLALLLVFSYHLSAQRKLQYANKNDAYVSFYNGALYFNSPEPAGIFSFSFPYIQTNINTGQVNNGVFSASRKFTYNPTAPLFGMEVGGGHGFFNMDFGLFTSNWPNSGLVDLGGGVMYGLGHTNAHRSIKYHSGRSHIIKGRGMPSFDSRFMLKLSLNLIGAEHSFDLGNIDNYNYNISVLGLTAGSNYTVHSKYSLPKTYDAKKLGVGYDDLGLSMMPKISISNNSFKNMFSFSASCTYILPFLKYDRVIFNQDGYSNSVGAVGIGSSGLATAFNGVSFSKSPFVMQGLYFSVSIGMNIALAEQGR